MPNAVVEQNDSDRRPRTRIENYMIEINIIRQYVHLILYDIAADYVSKQLIDPTAVTIMRVKYYVNGVQPKSIYYYCNIGFTINITIIHYPVARNYIVKCKYPKTI